MAEESCLVTACRPGLGNYDIRVKILCGATVLMRMDADLWDLGWINRDSRILKCLTPLIP